MTDAHTYAELQAIAAVIVQRRDELQQEVDSLNMDLQDYDDQMSALEESLEIDTMGMELERTSKVLSGIFFERSRAMNGSLINFTPSIFLAIIASACNALSA